MSEPAASGPAGDAPVQPGDGPLQKVVALTVELAEQVQAALSEGRPVSREQAVALRDSAHLLREAGVDWPPSLKRLLSAVADDYGRTAGTVAGRMAPVLRMKTRP